MRARNIKPGFFKCTDLSEVDFASRLLFIGLWCFADREGRFEWNVKKIKAELFPYDNVNIEKLLCNLMSLHFITRNDTTGYVEKFAKHQNPHPHEAKSALPPKPEQNQCNDVSLTSREMSLTCRADSLIPDSLIPDSKDKGAGPRQKIFKHPTPDEVGEYMLEIQYQGNPQQFCDYYASKGWMIGKNKMKDWKAAVRTWRSNGYERSIQSGGGATPTGAKKGSVTQADDTVKPPGYFAGDFPDRSSEW